MSLATGEDSTEDLLLRARLAAGQRVDARGDLVPLEPAALRDAWAAFRSRSPAGTPAPDE